MTIAEKFAREHVLACESEINNLMQRIANATVRVAEVPGRSEGDGVVHIFADDSWLDDETWKWGFPTANFERQDDGSLIVKYS